ncbi:Major Facilitator Superfamily protein [Roseibium album]|nr:Major Facilitator Superfamily protein [Roseibium album]
MSNQKSRQNWHFFLLHGLFYALKRRLAPPKVFLPFIVIAAGAPVFLAAIVVPLLTASTRASELAAAPLVSGSKQRKHYVIAGITGIAVGLLLSIIAIEVNLPVLTIVCLVIAAIVIGAGRGVGGLAYASLLPSLFDKEERGNLLNLEGVLSACAAIVVAFVTYHLFQGQKPINSHLALVWLAVFVAVPACLLLFPVKEPYRQKSDQPYGGTEQEGQRWSKQIARFKFCWGHVWFRRYLIARILLLSVTQVMPFYAIHAASLHKHQSGSYASFVIAMSLGAVLSGPILFWLAKRSLGTNFTSSILAGMIAASMALAIDKLVPDPQYYLYVPVFVLAGLAGQIAVVSQTVYLGELSGEESREYFVATSRFISGIIAVVFAAILGLLAEIQDEAIPIAVILGLNFLSLIYVLRVFPDHSKSRHRVDMAE